jgi:hypothetical protein
VVADRFDPLPYLSPTGAGLLGVTIKLDDYGGADERLVRVLEVEDHSPAAGTYMKVIIFPPDLLQSPENPLSQILLSFTL